VTYGQLRKYCLFHLRPVRRVDDFQGTPTPLTFMKKFLVISALALAVSGYSQETTNPVPVVIVAQSQPDVYPAFAAGFAFGLTIFGFGWGLRLAKRVARPDNG
jgi:hypothetical protein